MLEEVTLLLQASAVMKVFAGCSTDPQVVPHFVKVAIEYATGAIPQEQFQAFLSFVYNTTDLSEVQAGCLLRELPDAFRIT